MTDGEKVPYDMPELMAVHTRLVNQAVEIARLRNEQTRRAEITTDIITEIAMRQHDVCEGRRAIDDGWAHAHIATFIDLWNRFVSPIPGLDENSLRRPIRTQEPKA